MENGQTITNDTNFFAKRNITSISQYLECLKFFSTNFEDKISLKTNSPIFLDTNVLLRYYSISFTAREKLFQFIKKNKKRIVISKQVQYEFLKNREDVIQRFFEQVTTKIPKDFNSDVVNKMKSFLDFHKIVLKDYPFVEEGINKHQKELEAILKKLNENVELKRKELASLLTNDKFLELLNSCQLYTGLTYQENDLIKKDFDTMAKIINGENIDSVINKSQAVFPGIGDIKGKPDDPYGDYIIFHEMMKYMIDNKTDVIFLTFDNTKGDWMTKNKSPHLHYMQNMYANTGKILYIVDSERTLGDLLNVNIESLVLSESLSETLTPITIISLRNFSKTYPEFVGLKQGHFSARAVQELNENGYQFMEVLENDLNIAVPAALKYSKYRHKSFTTLGIIRTSLKIISDTYTQLDLDGSYLHFSKEDLKNYHDFRKFLKF